MNNLPRKAAIYTLGCRLNQADSGLLADDLQRHGYSVVPWGSDADVVVINSCTVTATAARKTRKAARAARKRFPNAFIVVIGCDVDVAADSWQNESAADLVLGNADKRDMCAWLQRSGCAQKPPAVQVSGAPDRGEAFTEIGSARYAERTRANLKVQEGCDFHCSYCIVPAARGPARSRDWNDVLREGRELIENGYKEIVLTGVNIAVYEDHGRDLADLLAALLELEGNVRFRLSSTEPGKALQRVVEIMSQNPQVCRFLHLPLQYGQNDILRAMNRRYSVEEFAHMATMAAKNVPGLGLGSDIIVGFPGETEEAFRQCCETVETLPINHLHVFTFSPRKGTPAASFPLRVAGDLAAARARTLSAIGKKKAEQFARYHVGKKLEIITEKQDERGRWEGWSDNYLRTTIENGTQLHENEVVAVQVRDIVNGRHVVGTIREDGPGR